MPACLPPLWTPETHTLFIGTLPGEKSLERGQYYANPTNQFWQLLTEVNGPCPVDYQERIQWLFQHGYGLWDVLSHADRQGSADADIQNPVANDFTRLEQELPSLQRLCFTSQKAAFLFDSLVPPSDYLTRVEKIILPSPSAAYASISLMQKGKIWKMYLGGGIGTFGGTR